MNGAKAPDGTVDRLTQGMASRTPRYHKTKFGLSLRSIAALSGQSLRTIGRRSRNDPESVRRLAESLLSGENSPAPEDNRIEQLEDVIWRVHFELCKISQPGTELRAKLEPVLALTRPVIEAICAY